MSAERKPFARIFDTEKYGQVLVCRSATDDGTECAAFTVDSHPEHTFPTTIKLALPEDVDIQEYFEGVDQQKAEYMAQAIFNQVAAFFGGKDGE